MSGGYANIFDTSAIQEIVLAAAAEDAAETEVTGAEVDREDYSDSDLLQHLAVVAIFDATLASGEAGDELNLTVEWEDGDTSGGAYADHKTVTKSVVVDDNTSCKSVVILPVKLLDSERYGVAKAQADPGTGAPTLSACTVSIVYAIFPLNGQPAAQYDKDGYVNSIIAA